MLGDGRVSTAEQLRVPTAAVLSFVGTEIPLLHLHVSTPLPVNPGLDLGKVLLVQGRCAP